MSFNNILVTCLIGLLGISFLLLLLAFCVLFIKFPWMLLAIVGLVILSFLVGWCIENYPDFYNFYLEMRTFYFPGKIQPSTYLPSYGYPVLDSLQRLEDKYGISTVQFMSFFYKEHVPNRMTNLDYLEWVSLVYELIYTYEEKGLDK